MRFLIYFIAFVVLAVIQTVIRQSGVVLGALPTALLFFLVLTVAGYIDKSRKNKK